jgi:hypothetical protein
MMIRKCEINVNGNIGTVGLRITVRKYFEIALFVTTGEIYIT